jgi:hypothetical protein
VELVKILQPLPRLGFQHTTRFKGGAAAEESDGRRRCGSAVDGWAVQQGGGSTDGHRSFGGTDDGLAVRRGSSGTASTVDG